jgi:hypothetical protein
MASAHVTKVRKWAIFAHFRALGHTYGGDLDEPALKEAAH